MLSEKTAIREKENDSLFAQYRKTKDVATRNKIVENNLPLADFLVRKYLNRGVDYDDLYQVASMALLLAAERFDSTKGYVFSSFAAPTIIGEIKRYFRDKGWSMKVPRAIQEIALNLPEAREDLSKKLSRPPTIPELSAYLGKSEEDILEAMESGKNYNMHSLDQSVDAAKEEDKYEKINEYAQINEKGYEQFENADIFRSVMKQLTEDERKVFVARLLRNRSQRDVAKDLNVSQMTVSRMESNIKKKLKEEYFQ